MKKLIALVLAGCCALLLVACGQKAITTTKTSNWPEREVRMVVPYKEGGGSYMVALAFKEACETNKIISKSVLAVAMPNANTLEGQEEVINATPDGYTLLMHHHAIVYNYLLGKQDFTFSDFEVIGQVYETPLLIGVRGDSPYNNLQDLANDIKENPGKVRWCWNGTGGNSQFSSYMFYEQVGVDGTYITPCITSSDAESVVNVLGDVADVVIAQPSSVGEYITSGDLKILGQSGSEPMTLAGVEIPTWKDEGFDATFYLRNYVFAPKGISDSVREALSKMVKDTVASQEFIHNMDESGFIPAYRDAAECTQILSQELTNAQHIVDIIASETK